MLFWLLHSLLTCAILLAISCICLSGPDSSSVSLGISLLFSSKTKQLRMAAHCSLVMPLNSPLKIISVRSSSSALLSSQAMRPLI